jgi:hypothetical protein
VSNPNSPSWLDYPRHHGVPLQWSTQGPPLVSWIHQKRHVTFTSQKSTSTMTFSTLHMHSSCTNPKPFSYFSTLVLFLLCPFGFNIEGFINIICANLCHHLW